ncbi:histidine phosphatase family protein [Cellulomonas hominis]|uniref:histidine phosphatase family protein n=1 Tax=Cellulomonas hominis TaxID=156981 RepID=UPI001B9700C4|nr:histidine phosphatase family protein [Cellulomonas hominis]VTR76876.1 Glucosyl-3-phosphoglycerate phosphatase [Cellulomonas hominis]
MTAGRVVFWRHGRTAHNASARLQGQSDIPLDDVGTWQAETAAAALASRYRPTRIIASDLVRAHATAKALAERTGLPLETDVRVRERSFGDWEGMTSAEIAERWPEQHAAWVAGREPERVGAETRAQVQARMVEAVTEQAADLGKDDTLVVVSHGAAINLGLVGLLGLPPEWRGLSGMSNAHWAELQPARPGAGLAWRLEALNVGPVHASSDWNAGPDRPEPTMDEEVRDPA